MDFWLVSAHIAPVNAILFDTLRLSRTLLDKGHSTPEQAEALAEALGEAAHDKPRSPRSRPIPSNRSGRDRLSDRSDRGRARLARSNFRQV